MKKKITGIDIGIIFSTILSIACLICLIFNMLNNNDFTIWLIFLAGGLCSSAGCVSKKKKASSKS